MKGFLNWVFLYLDNCILYHVDKKKKKIPNQNTRPYLNQVMKQ